MIFEPAKRISLHTKDLLSFIFDDPPYDQDEPVGRLHWLNYYWLMANPQNYIDVRNPLRSISCNQARSLIRKLIAGLHAAGLKKGDCALIHSFNDVSLFPFSSQPQ